MRVIKNFSKFKNINENAELVNDEAVAIKASELTGEVTLYRLTSHPVVDLSSPGEYYVCDKADVDPNILDKKEGSELYLLTVKTNSDNIDLQESEKEASEHGNDSIVAVKDSSKCKVISVEPYGNNPL